MGIVDRVHNFDLSAAVGARVCPCLKTRAEKTIFFTSMQFPAAAKLKSAKVPVRPLTPGGEGGGGGGGAFSRLPGVSSATAPTRLARRLFTSRTFPQYIRKHWI